MNFNNNSSQHTISNSGKALGEMATQARDATGGYWAVKFTITTSTGGPTSEITESWFSETAIKYNDPTNFHLLEKALYQYVIDKYNPQEEFWVFPTDFVQFIPLEQIKMIAAGIKNYNAQEKF